MKGGGIWKVSESYGASLKKQIVRDTKVLYRIHEQNSCLLIIFCQERIARSIYKEHAPPQRVTGLHFWSEQWQLPCQKQRSGYVGLNVSERWYFHDKTGSLYTVRNIFRIRMKMVSVIIATGKCNGVPTNLSWLWREVCVQVLGRVSGRFRAGKLRQIGKRT